MAQKPDGKAAKTERVTFTMDSAQRIGKVVRAVEAGSRDCAGLSFGRAPDSPGFNLQLATFTGTWASATYKTVTLSGSTQTASVYNWCNPVEGSTASTAQKYVIFGSIKGTASAVELPLSGGIVRIGKTTAAWNKGTVAAIPLWEDGTPPSETASGSSLSGCVNKFADVQSGKWVAMARGANGSHYLISAEC